MEEIGPKETFIISNEMSENEQEFALDEGPKTPILRRLLRKLENPFRLLF